MPVLNRRKFIKDNLLAGFLMATNPSGLIHPDPKNHSSSPDWRPEKKFGFSLGLASYTFRAFSLEQTIAMTLRLGLEKLVLKDFHLPLTSSPSEIKAAATRVRAAGLDLYGCGVVYLEKPEEVEQAFFYARAAELRMIIASPDPVLLPLIEKKTRETGIFLAIHNHGPGDRFYPTPADAYNRIKNLDGRLGLCLDIGHATRAGIDPSDAARKFCDRLLDIHLKDVSSASREGQTVEIGRGVIDIKKFLRTIVELKYRGTLAFEFEKDEKDPLPGLAESVGYVRGLIS
ncbi:MAG: sugar phosphate isomerase/epimerase [Candidatus Saccharicenans sp.]|nr:sugar phosphate isomerase/epimerase [Candidatus Saccharicenans sp.]